MYTVSVKVAKSSINGDGVFTQEDIPEGKVVWIFTANHDQTMTTAEFDKSTKSAQAELKHSGYLSPWTGYWVFPPPSDPARYTNHSNKNNLSVIFDASVSPEPYFITNRAIKKGEELTNNYKEFDKITQETKPNWAS